MSHFHRIYFIALCIGSAYAVGMIYRWGDFYWPTALEAAFILLGGFVIGLAIVFFVDRKFNPKQ